MPYSSIPESGLGRIIVRVDQLLQDARKGNLSCGSGGSSSSSSTSSVMLDKQVDARLKALQKILSEVRAILDRFDRGASPNALQTGLCIKNYNNIMKKIEKLYSPSSKAYVALEEYLEGFFKKYAKKRLDTKDAFLSSRAELVQMFVHNKKSPVHKAVMSHPDGQQQLEAIHRIIANVIGHCDESYEFNQLTIMEGVANSFERDMLPLSIDHPVLYQCFVEALRILHELPEDLHALLQFFNPQSLNMTIPIPGLPVRLAQTPEVADYCFRLTVNAEETEFNLEQDFGWAKRTVRDFLLALLQKTRCFQTTLTVTEPSCGYSLEFEEAMDDFERAYSSMQEQVDSQELNFETRLVSLRSVGQRFHELFQTIGGMLESYWQDPDVIFGTHRIHRDSVLVDMANRLAMQKRLEALKQRFDEFQTPLEKAISSAICAWHQFHSEAADEAIRAILACPVPTPGKAGPCEQSFLTDEEHIVWLERRLQLLAIAKDLTENSFRYLARIEQTIHQALPCPPGCADQQAFIDSTYQPVLNLVQKRCVELQRIAGELNLGQAHFESSLEKARAAKAAADLLASMDIAALQQTVGAFTHNSQTIRTDINEKESNLIALAQEASILATKKQTLTEDLSAVELVKISRQHDIDTLLQNSRQAFSQWVSIPEVTYSSHALATLESMVASQLFIHEMEQETSKTDITPFIDSLNKKMLKKTGTGVRENEAFVLTCIDKLSTIQSLLNASSGTIPFEKLEAIASDAFEPVSFERKARSSFQAAFGRLAKVFGLNSKDRGFTALFRLLGHEKNSDLQKQWLLIKKQQERHVNYDRSLSAFHAMVQYRLDDLKSLPDQEAFETHKAGLAILKDQLHVHVEPLYGLEQQITALQTDQAGLDARASMVASEKRFLEREIVQLKVDKQQLDDTLPVLNEIIAIYTANAHFLSDIRSIAAPDLTLFQAAKIRQQALVDRGSAIQGADYAGLIEQLNSLLASSSQQLASAMHDHYHGLIHGVAGSLKAIDARCHALDDTIAGITEEASVAETVTTGICALDECSRIQQTITTVNHELLLIQAELAVLQPGVEAGTLISDIDVLQQGCGALQTRLNDALIAQMNAKLAASGRFLDNIRLSEADACSTQLTDCETRLNDYTSAKDRLKTAVSPLIFQGKDAINAAISHGEQTLCGQGLRLEIKQAVSHGITQRQTARQDWSATVTNRLLAYQEQRRAKFGMKDRIIPEDQRLREQLITDVLALLPAYQQSGNPAAIRTLCEGYYKKFPGKHFRPLLSRILSELDTQARRLPGQYEAAAEELAVDIEARNRRIHAQKQVHERANSPFHRLYQRLESLDRYKNRLDTRDRVTVDNLVQQLTGKMDDFMSGSYNEHPDSARAFRKEFSHCLHSQDDQMANRRHSILFFGKTTRLKKVDEIHQLLKSITPG